ncbi:MAG: hypothetical protein AAF582_10955 [Pseudomonadota bacterium]
MLFVRFVFLAVAILVPTTHLTELSAQTEPNVESNYPTSRAGEFEASRLVDVLHSPMGLLQIKAPDGWQLAMHPVFEQNLADGMKVQTHLERDSVSAILREPVAGVRCDLSVSLDHSQTDYISGFGSAGGIRLSPEASYRVLLRGMRYHVDIPLTEYGETRRFKFQNHSEGPSPNLKRFRWDFKSEQGETSYGFGESDLRGAVMSILTCFWPRAEARGDEATILAAFRNRVSVREDEPQ